MALLSRLFSSRKNKQTKNLNSDKYDRSPWKPFAFSKDQVRVLLFRECDWRGRKLLFDSNAVQKVPIENSCKLRFTGRPKPDKTKEGFVEVTNGYGYQYTKPSDDAKLLGEMMFGAVAMTFRGTALKVHAMPHPDRLMCTKVFPSPETMHPNRRTSDKSLEDSFGSSMNSMSEYFSRSGSESLLESGSLEVPPGDTAGVYNSLAGDSGYCGDFSLQSVSSVGSNDWTPCATPESRNSFGTLYTNKQSGGSLSSLQRRWIRNMSTSLELGFSQSDEARSCNPHHRRTKLGLSVLITLTEEQYREMETFIFEHMSIIESMIGRLRHSVERAYSRKDMFVHLMYEGWNEMQQSLHDMLCIPRLPCPLWLSLGLGTADSTCHSNLAATFIQDLCQLIISLDTKVTNFFVSTLLTGVLTHHLGWVNTVGLPNLQTPNAAANSNMSKTLSELSSSHPYNPLWAQLGDLHGALGSPTKIAKTIITTNSRRTDCVNKLLTSMTYFIRCGEVKESRNMEYHEMDIHKIDTHSASSSTLKDSASNDTIRVELSPKRNISNNDTNTSSVFFDSCLPSLSDSTLFEPECVVPALSSSKSSSSLACNFSHDPTNLGEIFKCKKIADGPNSITNQKTDKLENIIAAPPCGLELPSITKILSPAKENFCLFHKDPMNAICDFTLPTILPEATLAESQCRSRIHESDYVKNVHSKPNLINDLRACLQDDDFKVHDLKRGRPHFCSPAGVEWETDEYGVTVSTMNSAMAELLIETDKKDLLSEHNMQHSNGGSENVYEILSYPSANSKEANNGVCFVNLLEDVESEDNTDSTQIFHSSFQNNLLNTNSNNKNSTTSKTAERYCSGGQQIGRFNISATKSNTNDAKLKTDLPSAVSQYSYDNNVNKIDVKIASYPTGTPSHHITYQSNNENDEDSRIVTSPAMPYHCSGLKSMKRTSSCRKKLSDMTDNHGIGLYPNIKDLAEMENIRLDDEAYAEDSKLDRTETYRTGIDGESETEDPLKVIADKVTKLSRVPTSAILFHLESGSEEIKALAFEGLDVKRFDSEMQMAAHGMTRRRDVVDWERDCTEKQSEVLFVLGDNEQLKGIKHQSMNNLNVGLDTDECKVKSNSDSNLKGNISSLCALSDSSFQVLETKKVVTVKSSYVDVEVESGCVVTEDNNEVYLKPFVTVNAVENENTSLKNAMSRSSSINLPISKRKRVRKTGKSRRHTEIYCDKCKTILKKNRDGISNESDVERTFLSCEKCHYTNRHHGSDSEGIFHRTKSERNGLNLIEGNTSDSTSSSREEDSKNQHGIASSLEADVEREKVAGGEVNAMFEQYNPSDEEIRSSKRVQITKRMQEVKDFGFEDLHLVELPLPSGKASESSVVGLARSLMGGVSNRYVSDLVLQGCSSLPIGWETVLKRDLALAAKLPLLGQDVTEAVCVVADANTWEVQLVSSHAYVVDKAGSFGVRVGMSQLVANMLESLVLLWRLKTPPDHCLLHLENKLRELFLRSQALAELLLTTEFCNMALLTSSLDLEANDVPLLLAVASTHSPQIANRYGLSFV